MKDQQLRQALRELNGERDLELAFVNVHHGGVPINVLQVKRAMLIPAEQDELVKVTDGKSVYIIDAERIAWVRIGLK